jgi:ParB family chromosome partitioning protein
MPAVQVGFAATRGERHVLDAMLLDRLVMEKLTAVADTVRAEGWAWVEVMTERDYGVLSQHRRIYPERVPLTNKQEAQRTALSEEYDGLINSREADENDEATLSRLAEIEQLLDEIDAVETVCSAAALSSAGAIVMLSVRVTLRSSAVLFAAVLLCLLAMTMSPTSRTLAFGRNCPPY